MPEVSTNQHGKVILEDLRRRGFAGSGLYSYQKKGPTTLVVWMACNGSCISEKSDLYASSGREMMCEAKVPPSWRLS